MKQIHKLLTLSFLLLIFTTSWATNVGPIQTEKNELQQNNLYGHNGNNNNSDTSSTPRNAKASLDIPPPPPIPKPPTNENPTPPTTEEPLKIIAGSEADGQQALVDLTTDLVADSALLDHILNTPDLTVVENVSINYKLDAQTGLLHGQWNNLDTTLRAVSATNKENGEQPGIKVTIDGHVQMITENGRKIIFQVEKQAFDSLKESLEQISLQIKHDTENNLIVFGQSNSGSLEIDSWFNLRPALLSKPVNDDSETAGIETFEYTDLPDVVGYYHQFIKEGQLYRQNLHATPADWNSLKNFLNNLPGAETVSLGVDGVILARINGVDYSGRVGARINPVDTSQPILDKTYLVNMNDVNGDGRVDFKIIYPNGTWQMLYLL